MSMTKTGQEPVISKSVSGPLKQLCPVIHTEEHFELYVSMTQSLPRSNANV